MGGPLREALGAVRSQKERGDLWARVVIVVSAGNKGKAEKAGLGYTSLNNFSGLWHTGDVPSCQVPGPG